MALEIKHFNRIAAPPEKVWEQFADVEGWPSWIPTFRGARWSEGEAWTDGSRLRMTMGLGPATLGVDVTIVNVDLPHSIAWTGRRFGVTSIHTWTFTPDRDGTIMTSEEVFDGPAPQLLGVTGLSPMISRITEYWMDSLQKRVEGTQEDSPSS